MSTTGTSSRIGRDLVVVGSSAGGIEALSILVSTLPVDFPASLVIAQHLDPNRSSTLNLILQRRTNLPIVLVTSQEQLKPGTIYVVPSNYNVSIRDHIVEIHNNNAKHPRPSIDTLLSTAADAYGDGLFAVILTGLGTDGAIGAVDVKNAGGTVIVQDPYTARSPSMPLSPPPTAVDFSLPVERIGHVLYDLLMGEKLSQGEQDDQTENALQEILHHVSRQANIDFRSYKTSTILRRIGRRMTMTHCRTMRDYIDYLKINPSEVGELVKAFLINVTQFFRDAEAFTYLKTEIIPKLIERSRDRDRVLRFWAAGCSTGEEPYSLAMLLTDVLAAELPEWSIKIFATDLDESAINFARRGLYSDNMLKGLPVAYRDRFFEHVDHGYRISKTLRQMVIFGQQDLSRSAPFPRIDVVLCRNVLIYFTPELQDYVLNQFAFSLNPDGYLFLGKAETVRPTQPFYELVNKHSKIYRCTGNALPSIRRQSLMDIYTPHSEGSTMNRESKHSSKQHHDQDTNANLVEIGQLRRFNEVLLRFLPVGIVIIDRAYHILTVNGSARRLLSLRDVSVEQDFLHAVRGIPYQETRNAIDSVFRERSATTLTEVELDVDAGGNGRFVNLSIAPMQLEATLPDFVTISIVDVTEQVQIRRQLQTVQTEQQQLMNDLSSTNKRLSDVNKELMDANEELQVANEELVLTHEELQASIEEFETTNEELQATNEELETNNEELQATNEELETTNDELRARTGELQEFMSVVDNERIRLSEIVTFAPFYILVLQGSQFIVDAYNPRYARLLEGRSIQGHPLETVLDIFWDETLASKMMSLTREVYRLETMRTFSQKHLPLTGKAEDGTEQAGLHNFIYTLVPSHNITGKVDGVIIYAIDETEQQQEHPHTQTSSIHASSENDPRGKE
jgi:two-component system CheB/CheR fusion protein